MRSTEVRLELKPGNPWVNLKVLSDLHLGNKDVDLDALRREIKQHNKLPNHRYILNGDNADSIVSTDIKRYQPSRQVGHVAGKDNYLKAIVEYKLDILKDARPLDLVVMGNHEEKLLRVNHMDVVDAFCSAHPDKPTNGGMCGFISYIHRTNRNKNHGGYTVTILYHHGAWYGMARVPSGALRWAHEGNEGWDIFCFGHNHKTGGCIDPKMRPPQRSNGGDAIARDLHIVGCGTFLRNYMTRESPGYSEVRGHSVSAIGAPLIRWHRATTGRHELSHSNSEHSRPEIVIER